jgi:hypothetical protein
MDGKAYQELFYKKPPPANFSRPASEREAKRQDAEYFRNYIELERSITPKARVLAEHRADMLLGKVGTISSAKFVLEIASIVALAHNGHSQLLDIGLQADGQRYKRFPFSAHLFPEGACVTGVMKGAEALLGHCITRIDGVPIKDVVATLRAFYGGSDEHFGVTTVFLDFLHHPDFLFAAGISRNAEKATFTYRTRSGHVASQTIAAVPSETADSRANWEGLFPADVPLPLYLRHPDEVFVREPLSETHGIYLQLKMNDDYRSQSIREFLDASLVEIAERKPRFVVVDFRGNTGGDFTKTTSAMSQLPKVMPEDGRIYVIADGGTFSAAITNINVLKQVGGSRTMIVGEPVGSGQRFWAEGGRLCLPNSKICLAYARGLHDYANGCDGEAACYESAMPAAIPLRVKSLRPDIPVAFTFADYVAGRDAALDAILSAERKR